MKNDEDIDDKEDWTENLVHNPNHNGNPNQVMKMFFLILQIGITMLVTIFLCIGIGYFVDRFFETRLMVWFIVLGVIAGFRSVYILIRKFIGNE